MTNQQYETVISRAKAQNINLSKCPTCGQTKTEVAPGIWVWLDSTYKLNGEEHECDCETQDELRRHYILANIPMGYWTLSEDQWYGDEDAFQFMINYLDRWEDNKRLGIGVEFYSPRLGVGKTMLALIIAKELVRRKEKVLYMPFLNVVHTLIHDPEGAEALFNAPVLILDEVKAGYSDAQHALFADKFEELIRFRTAGASVTIVTTNLTPEEIQNQFGRVYSLLTAKQHRYHVQGVDMRADGTIKMDAEELIANGEVRPIQ